MILPRLLLLSCIKEGRTTVGNKPEYDTCIVASFLPCKTILCVLEEQFAHWLVTKSLQLSQSVGHPGLGQAGGSNPSLIHPMEVHPQSSPRAATEAAEGWQR